MIEFLFWEGCPSHERALAELIAVMDEYGLEREHLRITEVLNDRDAEREAFIGSPTIRVNGEDIADPGENVVGLNCRVYFKRDGRPSALPDPDDLKETIAEYASERE
jgi:hypothetical protein